MMQSATLALVGLLTLALPAAAQTAGTFVRIPDMTTTRSFSAAIPLPDGRVLIFGGDREATMELYDPGVSGGGAFTRVNFTMGVKLLSATPIDGGRVLLAAASADSPSNQVPSSVFAIVFDPARGTAALGGSMVEPQLPRSGTLLRNGKVLFAGGIVELPMDGAIRLAIPELYDLATGTFSFTGSLATTGCTFYVCGGPDISAVALLSDGKVLIAGEPNSEIYDPASATFALTGRMVTPCVLGGTPQYIAGRTATLLSNGKVLLTGGAHEDCGRFADAELYDPQAGTFTAIGSMTRARDNHRATLLSDGTVLITGGETQECVGNWCVFSGTTTIAEVYDPSTNRFAPIGTMTDPRAGHTSTLLQNGSVLITGGYCYGGIGSFCGAFASAEVYTPR